MIQHAVIINPLCLRHYLYIIVSNNYSQRHEKHISPTPAITRPISCTSLILIRLSPIKSYFRLELFKRIICVWLHNVCVCVSEYVCTNCVWRLLTALTLTSFAIFLIEEKKSFSKLLDNLKVIFFLYLRVVF